MRDRSFPRGVPFAIFFVSALLSISCTSGLSAVERDRELRIAVARRNVGIDYLAKGRTALAIRDLRYALSRNPDDPVTMNWLGEAYRRRGLLDQALQKFLEATEADPDDHSARLNLAGLYIQLKSFPEAIEHCQVLVDDPTFPAPWTALTNRGWAELQLGRRADARASLEEALAFRPRYWPARLNLGILENNEGHRLAAIVNFEYVLERDLGGNANAEANFRMGEVYVALGRRSKALDHFKVAVMSSPEGSWGKQSEEYLKLLH